MKRKYLVIFMAVVMALALCGCIPVEKYADPSATGTPLPEDVAQEITDDPTPTPADGVQSPAPDSTASPAATAASNTGTKFSIPDLTPSPTPQA